MDKKLKFLVIDDEADITTVLSIYIWKYFEDSTTKTSTDPLDAIELVREGYQPDIIVLDLNMPQMHGLKVVEKLFEINPKLNIIIYSGAISQVELVNHVELGIKGILEKPSAPEELRDEVLRILNTDKKNNQNNEFMPFDLSQAQIMSAWKNDVFVIIGKSKYVKIFRRGDEIDYEKVTKMLKETHVRYATSKNIESTLAQIHYLPIDIITIKVTQKSPCDIFTKREGEYKKIISKATPILKDYLNLLAKKDIKQLYIEAQFQKYFVVIPENILILKINDQELKREEKVSAILNFADQKLGNLYSEPTESNILGVETLSEYVTKYLHDDREALVDILNFKAEHDAKAHALNVATLSTAIFQYFEDALEDEEADKKVVELASNLSFKPAMKKNLVLAGLLHDLESAFKYSSGEHIHAEKENKKEELSQSMKILSQIKSIPPIVLEIIDQHEERFDGSGPKKLMKSKINLYAQILIVTDQYQILLSKGMTPQVALAVMFKEKAKYNELMLQALKCVVV